MAADLRLMEAVNFSICVNRAAGPAGTFLRGCYGSPPMKLPRALFLALTPVVAVLVCAQSLGLWFPGWSSASLEALAGLAMIGAFSSSASAPRGLP